MTSNIIPVAASNGADTTTSERERPKPGLPKLRDMEAKALIHLGLDALSEAANLGHDMHKAIYDKTTGTEAYPELKDQLTEVLTCLETAEHYLFMLGTVFEEHPARNGPLKAVPPSQ
jgi:hypothetical protein